MKLMNLLSIFVLLTFTAFAQTFTEKKLASFITSQNADLYAFKYDKNSGAYVYGDYDTTLKKSTLYTNKGKAGMYDNLITWNAFFDKDGNSYIAASNNITDTTYTYFILKNGEPVTTFDYIDENWAERYGTLYILCRENNKNLIVTFNTADGKILKSKPYDDIILCSMKPYQGGEGEPIGEIGFTDDGKAYYVAVMGDDKFLVVGDAEQKHYSDIDMYSFAKDNKGGVAYIAKSIGKFYEVRGNTFVVQGDKEYKSYDYIYGPIIFDANNIPVYTSSDSSDTYMPQRVMVGNKEEKTYSGGIYDVKFTPSGKLAYVGALVKKNNVSEYFVVVDGKEGKKYSNISNLTFGTGDEPIYTSYKNDNEGFVVKGNKVYEYDYSNVYDLMFLPNGKIVNAGVIYGNYEKKIRDKYFVNYGDDQLGPYDGIPIANYLTNQSVLTDNSGGYAFIAERVVKPDDYISKFRVVTNKDETDEYDGIQDLSLYKGKPIFTTWHGTNKLPFIYTYKIMNGDKQVGVTYEGISDYKFDEATGTAAFLGAKNKEFYLVEMKF
jgi:hypothetical protein